MKNIKRIIKFLIEFLPVNRVGNWVYFRAYFYYSQRRWPDRERRLVNDLWFRILTGPECKDAARQFTTDKEFVKTYTAGKIGADYCIPTLALLSTRESIESFVAPDKCVLKPSHNSQMVIFVEAGQSIMESDVESLVKSLSENRYRSYREANYQNLRPRIIAEPVILVPTDIIDYKIFCRKGQPRIIQVDLDRHCDHKQAFFSTDWERLPIRYIAKAAESVAQPRELKEMINAARALAADFDDVRVDLYAVNGQVLVGEMTHVPNRSFGKFSSFADEVRFSKIYFGSD